MLWAVRYLTRDFKMEVNKIHNINFLDNWNKSLTKKLTPKELDSLYHKLILKDLFQSN